MFLLIASLGMVVFLIAYVVPRMSDLFKGFGGNLPFVTQVVLTRSGWLT
jgi:type IV pilus assembly protein PilC